MFGSLPFATINDFTFFTLVLGRIAGIFAAIPLFGGHRVPVTIRASAILAMSLVLFPVVRGHMGPLPNDTISLVILIIRETLVGLTLSLLSQIIFAGVNFCGQVIGTQMGLSIASVLNPDIGQVPVIANLQDLIATLLFLSFGIHHVFIRAIVDSYSVIPIGAWHMSDGLMKAIVAATSGLFVIAIKLSAPVMVSLLAAGVVLGIMARSFPQMNIFMISFPLNIGIGFLVLGFTLMAFCGTLAGVFDAIPGQIKLLFRLMA
jgi:flagellar biosynthesis protein FliR